jgi:hypothetical protein
MKRCTTSIVNEFAVRLDLLRPAVAKFNSTQ